MIKVPVKMITCGIIECMICKCNKACKIEEYLDTKNCFYEKRLVGKLWRCNIKCEDEILNVNMKMKY